MDEEYDFKRILKELDSKYDEYDDLFEIVQLKDLNNNERVVNYLDNFERSEESNPVGLGRSKRIEYLDKVIFKETHQELDNAIDVFLRAGGTIKRIDSG